LLVFELWVQYCYKVIAILSFQIYEIYKIISQSLLRNLPSSLSLYTNNECRIGPNIFISTFTYMYTTGAKQNSSKQRILMLYPDSFICTCVVGNSWLYIYGLIPLVPTDLSFIYTVRTFYSFWMVELELKYI
jgi:hypothetical protein